MVSGVVKQPVGIVAPVFVLLRQHVRQPRQEHQHEVRVSVLLRQADVKLPIGVDCRDHVHLVAERLGRHGVRLSTPPPLLVSKVQVRQPGLVNVDDALASLQQRQHFLGVKHPGD